MEQTLKHPTLDDEEFTRLIELDKKEIRGTINGAERIELYLGVEFTDQCNFELSVETIQKLARVGMPVLVSCVAL